MVNSDSRNQTRSFPIGSLMRAQQICVLYDTNHCLYMGETVDLVVTSQPLLCQISLTLCFLLPDPVSTVHWYVLLLSCGTEIEYYGETTTFLGNS